MKLRQMIAQKKLKASTAVRRTNAATRAATMEEEEAEPTMRLSTAFVVVLLLHIVAIGGVYTFDAVKVNRPTAAAEADAAELADAEGKVAPISHAAALASAGQEGSTTITTTTTTTSTAATAKTSAKPAAASAKSAPQPVANSSAPAASGKVHTVEKGENPVVIAKKYGVDYDTLLALNKIDDPRRLRIGQKLQIPTK